MQSKEASRKRFEFGKNWKGYLSTLNPDRIQTAEHSMLEMLRMEDLRAKKVLDIGSGSGLFSLAARNLHADVHSFDYDQDSVDCAEQLRRRFHPECDQWRIEQGSVLDEEYMESLGKFDLVYSWGVLHHTGDMWTALANAADRVSEGGTLFVALYNDQGAMSRFWKFVKECYCSSTLGKAGVLAVFFPVYFLRVTALSLLKRKNLFVEYKRNRGMSMVHDWFDWLGGFPFEVAKVEDVLEFLRPRGFVLDNLKTTNRLGCNQLVLSKRTGNAALAKDRRAA